MQRLDEIGAPLPRASQSRRRGTGWSYSTVERLMRNPVLAGMAPYNPGNSHKERGSDVLRDEHGLPVVDPTVAVMTPSEWWAMVAALDSNDSPRAKPHALRSKTSALLSGLVWCGACDARMHRGTSNGRESYSCPRCHQTISRIQDYVVEQFLWAKGEHVRWTPVREVYESGAAVLPEIEARLDELDAAFRSSRTPCWTCVTRNAPRLP
ncbi:MULTISPECIES: recombinase zinc beta ribbon domain-containing protein [Micrococcus]|uniref:recombinase zinc beta ribbon domain-containing protein n=1 Tax=Micrococcus TaxID=1269 RepID=UPI000A02ECF4|nr:MULTISPECIES: recombinase zinc beta ribbon domain-containing protein [Micrococcus]